MDIKFRNAKHKEDYLKMLSKMKSKDCYYQSVAYLLTLDSECVKHLNSLFDFSKGQIKLDGLDEPWQTGTSKKTTRLAFNLWNSFVDKEEPRLSAPDAIFCSTYAAYYWEANSASQNMPCRSDYLSSICALSLFRRQESLAVFTCLINSGLWLILIGFCVPAVNLRIPCVLLALL